MLPKNILLAIEKGFGCPAPGFFVYHDPEKGKYYVCFTDEKGKVQLLSKPYSTERNCGIALQRFQEGKFQTDIKEGEGGFYIEFKSEAGKVIACSPRFPNQGTAARLARQIAATGQQEAPGDAAVADAEKAEGAPPRHSFRIDFYRGERAGGRETPVRGRIEYSLTQESSAFQGLDMSFVRSFIARHLGQVTAPENTGEVGTGKIRILQNGRPAFGAVFSRQQPLEVALDIDIPPDAAYDAIVYAKSLSDNRQVLIGRKKGTGAPILVALK